MYCTRCLSLLRLCFASITIGIIWHITHTSSIVVIGDCLLGLLSKLNTLLISAFFSLGIRHIIRKTLLCAACITRHLSLVLISRLIIRINIKTLPLGICGCPTCRSHLLSVIKPISSKICNSLYRHIKFLAFLWSKL